MRRNSPFLLVAILILAVLFLSACGSSSEKELSTAREAVEPAGVAETNARAQAEEVQRDAQAALEEARSAQTSAPAGKGTRADREALANDLRAAETSFSEGQEAFREQRYTDATSKFNAAQEEAGEVKRAFEQASLRGGRSL